MESHKHHHCEVAKVRKPAPQFEAMSYFNGFKKVKLSDYAGMYSFYSIFTIPYNKLLMMCDVNMIMLYR